MAKDISAGLIMWDIIDGEPRFLIAKPGGPYFWKKKDKCFGIPKGHVEHGENIKQTAIREFKEETSLVPTGPYTSADYVKYKSGKVVHAWIFQGHFDGSFKSNDFPIEWPPKSGKTQMFPELEHPVMATIEEARNLMMISQLPFVDTMEKFFKEKGLL